MRAEPGIATRGRIGAGGVDLPTAEHERRLRRLELVGGWLDDRFRIPGLGIRFGLDPILGLVPGIGDGIAAIIALYTVLEARRLGASGGVVARMLLNIGIDTAVGSVPVLGDLFDVGFKSNRRNLTLLRRHLARQGR